MKLKGKQKHAKLVLCIREKVQGRVGEEEVSGTRESKRDPRGGTLYVPLGKNHGGCCFDKSWWPIPGKVKPLLISGKKSASLLDHISRFLSHQFVTWYLRSISKTKIVKLFCPCMSEHMIYIKNVTNVTQTLHQNVTNVTKQNIAYKEILTIEFHTKYMKLFVNMLSVICVLLNTKFHNTSENFYFEVILSRTIVSCKVTNVTNRYMDFIPDLDEEFNFQRPVCLDSNRMH